MSRVRRLQEPERSLAAAFPDQPAQGTTWRWVARTRREGTTRGHVCENGPTNMNSLLRDLYGHQIWADAEHWRAIGAHTAACDDKAIRDRLHHITIVQRAFLWAVGDRQDQFAFTTPDDRKSTRLNSSHPSISYAVFC